MEDNKKTPLYVKAYRADPTGKFGGKDKLETLPTTFDKEILYQHLSVLPAAEKLGVPRLSTSQLANMFLTEGRADAGYNGWNENNKKAAEIYETLIKQGFKRDQAGFAAAIFDKQQTAKRLGKDFNEVWNGTGVSDVGRTGKQHAQRMAKGAYAVNTPKNKELVSYIDSVRNDTLSPSEKVAANYSDSFIDSAPQIKEQVVKDLSRTDPSASKFIEEMDVTVFENFLINSFLRNNNVEEENLDLNEGDLEVFNSVGHLTNPDLFPSFAGIREINRKRMDQRGAEQLLMSKPTVVEALNRYSSPSVGQQETIEEQPFVNKLLSGISDLFSNPFTK